MRASLGRMMGSGDGYAAYIRRRRLRVCAIVSAAILFFVAIAVVGYQIGTSQVGNAGAAQQEGLAAGERRGKAVGTREGYASGFKPARDRAYDAAYDEAYRAAYLAEFEGADLAAPSRVEVNGP